MVFTCGNTTRQALTPSPGRHDILPLATTTGVGSPNGSALIGARRQAAR
jgi:hypothetical protein